MNTAILQKTQEIVFAVVRVSAYIRRFELRKNIERISYQLLENVASGNPEMALANIHAAKSFILLGKNLHEIEIINAKILLREIDTLETHIRSFSGLSQEAGLSQFFSEELPIQKSSQEPKKTTVAKKKVAVSKEIHIPAEISIDESEIKNEEIEYSNDNAEAYSDNAAKIRKEKIAVMISTAPERRLSFKEIVSAFPDVSDRTIRYDLKSLSEEGRILRQGSGGPSNYYKAADGGDSSVINL